MRRSTKRLILITLDVLMIVLAMLTSMNFVELFTTVPLRFLLKATIVAVIVYLIVSIRMRVFSILTRYTDVKTLTLVGACLAVAHIAVIFAAMTLMEAFSYRFVFLSFIFSFIYTVTPRIVWRGLHERQHRQARHDKKKRTLVVGAGSGGNLFISTVLSTGTDIDIIGVVDNDKNKQGTYIQGKRVLGTRQDIPHIVREFEVEQVTIAIPSISGSEKEKIVEMCNELGIKANTMPNVEDIILGKVSTQTLKEIDVADLLGRDEVVLDQTELGSYFAEKTLLVTGAGGSIGSEICRQVLKFKPKKLLLLGHGENSIYLIHRELTGKYGKDIEIIPIIADIQDRALIFEIMATYQPNVVYHAAAHKHVPLMELNPQEAVKNNIFGTKNVAEAAKAANVEKFVMVSTDKAVNPPNVMGASKRIAEMIIMGLNEVTGTQFSAVRFGNVLGSRGSVVPLFKDQIAKGGPLTVTDFRMTRYFMTIPEASRLVIQAGYLAKGGEVFILDMGKPVQILELARKVIKLSGYTEDEIKIVETGIRPGEKLYEELLSTEERVSEQVYDKIFVGRVTNYDWQYVMDYVQQLPTLSDDALKVSLIDFAKQE